MFLDPNGHSIICDIEANGKPITLANIYAPNDDDPNFFESFFEHLSDFQCEEIIIGGDFNLVLDLEKDKKGGLARTHKNALKVVQDFSEILDLVDIWRILNSETKRYTWRRKHPDISCRLDFFLVSESLTCDITHSDIVPRFKTDHSMITLTISLHCNPRGNGFWKLNTSLLSETSYIEQVKIRIQQTADEYKEDDSVNPALLWEMIKLKVRKKSISYAASKKAATQKRENELEREITALEKILDTTDCAVLLYHIAAEKIDILKRRTGKKYSNTEPRVLSFDRNLTGITKAKKT